MKPSFIPDVASRTLAIKRFLLGLFILIQLAFLFVANIGSVAFYFRSDNAIASSIWTVVDACSEPWAHATAQEQHWRMFAPAVPARASFVRMRAHFENEIVPIPSEFEPLPGKPILHLPGSGERIWHVEKDLAAPFLIYDENAALERLAEWRAYLHHAIGAERPRYLAYMAWRSRRYLDAAGDSRIPKQVDLLVSLHTLSRHDRSSTPEYELLVLRWRPAVQGGAALQLCIDTARGVECGSFDE
jgi:hypothetical protein